MNFLGHPRGLAYLVFAEAWERFSFYGMQALLVLYMAGHLLQPDRTEHVLGLSPLRRLIESWSGAASNEAVAASLFGLYGGAVYLTPVLGGWIADRFLGRRRTVTIGALSMAAGHFLLAFEKPFLLGLLCIVLGNGCFKGNIAAQVGALYASNDPRRADAFQLFYLGINGGAIAAPLVCGSLGELVGWHYGFGVAGVGMLVGLAIYLAGRRHLPPDSPAARTHAKLTGEERRRMLLLLALLPVFALEAVGNQQIFNGYMLWVRSEAGLTLFGRALPLSWLVTLDTVLGVGLLVGTVGFWRWWSQHRSAPGEMTKIAIGSVFATAAMLVLALAAFVAARTGDKVGLPWFVVFHLCNGIGFANVFPVALAFYARVAPARFASTIVGIYYLQIFAANLLTGWLGGWFGRIPATQFWLAHAALVGSAALVFALLRMRQPLR